MNVETETYVRLKDLDGLISRNMAQLEEFSFEHNLAGIPTAMWEASIVEDPIRCLAIHKARMLDAATEDMKKVIRKAKRIEVNIE